MDARIDVPEITTACWDILGKAAGLPVPRTPYNSCLAVKDYHVKLCKTTPK